MEGVLLLHLLWCVWVLLGWTVTLRRAVLRALHIASPKYAIVVESIPWIVVRKKSDRLQKQRVTLRSRNICYMDEFRLIERQGILSAEGVHNLCGPLLRKLSHELRSNSIRTFLGGSV